MPEELFTGPSAGELIEAVVESLSSLVPEVPSGRAFELRAAINTLQIVGRELVAGDAVERDHADLLAATGVADDAHLARGIRSGEVAVDDRLVAALVEDVRRRLAVDNPRAL